MYATSDNNNNNDNNVNNNNNNNNNNLYNLDTIMLNIKNTSAPLTKQIAIFKVKVVLYILVHVFFNNSKKSSKLEKLMRLGIIEKLKKLKLIPNSDINQVSSVAGRIYNTIIIPNNFTKSPPQSLLEIRNYLFANEFNFLDSKFMVNAMYKHLKHEANNLTNLRLTVRNYAATLGILI